MSRPLSCDCITTRQMEMLLTYPAVDRSNYPAAGSLHHCHTSAEQISASKSHCCLLYLSKTENNMFWYCPELSVWARHIYKIVDTCFIWIMRCRCQATINMCGGHTQYWAGSFLKWPHADRKGGGNYDYYLWQWYHFLTCLSTETTQIEWLFFFCSNFVT